MEERNKPAGSSLPTVTLAVLVVIVAALLYIAYAYFMDDDAVTLTPQKVETSAIVEGNSEASDVPIPQAVEPDVIDATPTVSKSASDTSTVSRPKKVETPKTETAKKVEKPATPDLPKASVVKPIAPRGGSVSHTVNGGQTMYSIATKYGMSESRLKAANPDVDPSKLPPGKSLKVPVYAMHTVGKGDILRVVAEKYGVTVEALMKANGKTKNYAEKGEKLIIPYPKK